MVPHKFLQIKMKDEGILARRDSMRSRGGKVVGLELGRYLGADPGVCKEN